MKKLSRNHQNVVLKFVPQFDDDPPLKFRMSIIFDCDTEESSSIESSSLNVENKYICPKTFHMDTCKFSYMIAQLQSNSPFRCRDNEDKVYLFNLVLYEPVKYYIDYKSDDIATMSMVEKRELEHSLNWLSTLGGAFSALGENSDSFAVRAGAVSKGQFLIALKLGSPQTISRCRLYAAISLLQLGKLQTARQILEREWAYANSLDPDSDPRLKRMCKGIWCKLQWTWKQQRIKGKKGNGTTVYL